jgi:CRISPR system Cascade subunit CasA
MAHDLLVEPILSWRDRQRQRRGTTLPGLLTRLASGELADFPRVRTHQLDPWCMFLTQLAAIALHRAGETDARISDDRWRQLLLALSDGAHEPWSLVVSDLAKPAFFQPPVPEGHIDRWNICESPDDIDVLVTAKGHDTKPALMHGDEPELWCCALCTLQTMQGYPGRGYNRVARMNGGYGNRPRVGLAADQSLSSRFLRDVSVLLDSWPNLLHRGYSDAGVALVWLETWDGRTSLAMHDLAPHFIEVCWRVRCREWRSRVQCLYTTTHVRRCLPEVETGDVGDAWIPVERATRNALTVGQNGLDYRLLTRLLFEGDFEPAPAQASRPTDGDPVVFIASALARGQGKTEGLHQRSLVLAGAVRRKLGEPDGRATLGRRASARVVAAATMRSKVLYPALKRLALEGTPMPDDLDGRIDEMFFDHLFETITLADDDARIAFERRIAELAWSDLQRAIGRFGGAEARKFRSISDAERIFRISLKKNFPDASAAPVISEGASA